MKKPAFLASLLLVLAAFAALVYAPAEAAEAARRGLSVCAGIIVPSLLPFLIVSALLTGLGVPRLLSRAAGPLMGRLFGVSGAAAVPLLLGLTGGYPVGAAATADLVRRGEIDAREAERILPFCNNTGPAFIVGAAGSGAFGSAKLGLLLYAAQILAAVALGLLSSVGRPRNSLAAPELLFEMHSLPQVLPESVKGAVAATLNICGFVVCFSVVTGLLDALGVFSAAVGRLSALFGLELHFARALLTGFLELGSGVSALSGLSPLPQNLALAAFILGFGGLSVHCQTLSAVAGEGIGTGRHFAGRLLHGVLSAGIAYGLAALSLS